MIVSGTYDRDRALQYAREWALSRNPLFFDFTGRGGNCTNFVSQCILAGSCTMDPTETFGWYYRDANDRSPSWAGVDELYDFLTGSEDFPPTATRRGPFGAAVSRERAAVGDVIQLSNRSGSFYHSLFISGFRDGDILVCAQSDNALDRPLSSYNYEVARFIHIVGFNALLSDREDCFEALIAGSALPPADVIFVPQIAITDQEPQNTTE